MTDDSNGRPTVLQSLRRMDPVIFGVLRRPHHRLRALGSP